MIIPAGMFQDRIARANGARSREGEGMPTKKGTS